jgi:aldehyde:ferredoxin oxidoreductase
MNNNVQKILEINLTKNTAEAKSFEDLRQYVGGTGLGLKLMELYQKKDPVIFSIGPLNGFFPYASKTSIIAKTKEGIEDLYVGGSLSLRIRYAGLNAIVIYGKADTAKIINILNDGATFEKSPTETSDIGLPGKRSVLEFEDVNLVTDNFFRMPNDILEKKFIEKNLAGIVITGTKTFSPKNFTEYEGLYEKILDKKDLLITSAYSNPSCSNCPLGCEKAEIGELGGNVLLHSLVACTYAEKLYSDIGLVFSCLNVLGYDYTHEDLENLPNIIEGVIQNLNKGPAK